MIMIQDKKYYLTTKISKYISFITRRSRHCIAYHRLFSWDFEPLDEYHHLDVFFYFFIFSYAYCNCYIARYHFINVRRINKS